MAHGITLYKLDATALREAFSFLCHLASEIAPSNHGARPLPAPSEGRTSPTTATLDGVLVPPAEQSGLLAEGDVETIQHLALVAFFAISDLPSARLADSYLLEQMEALRGLLEIGYGQRITFLGEDRPRSGTPIVKADAESARRLAKAIRPPVPPRIVGHPAVPDLLVLPPDPPTNAEGEARSDSPVGEEREPNGS